MQDRRYGRDSRIGDGSGRQPRMLVGVVRIAAGQVGFVNGAAIVAGEQRRIDGGRVAIELHPDGQAAGENGSDDGPLAGELAFLFHQGGQRDRAVRGSICAQAAPDFAKLAGHGQAQLLGCGGAAQAVGVREQVALQGGRQRVEIADERGVAGRLQESFRRKQAELLGGRRDIEHVLALGHHQLVIEDVAVHDTVENFQHGCRLGKAIFAGLENGAVTDGARDQERPGVADDAGVLQRRSHLTGTGALGQIDEGLRVEAGIGRVQVDPDVGHAPHGAKEDHRQPPKERHRESK